MQEIENPSLEQIAAFLATSRDIRFDAEGRADVYAWVDRTLRQQNYTKLGRQPKGLMRQYVKKMTGLSRGASDPADPAACQDAGGQAHRVPAGGAVFGGATQQRMWRYWCKSTKPMGGSTGRLPQLRDLHACGGMMSSRSVPGHVAEPVFGVGN